MSMGYQVSALHRLSYLDMSALHTRPIVRGENPVLDAFLEVAPGATVADGPVHMRSPTTENILSWRQRIASKYHDQLDGQPTWDEYSDFEDSDDVASSQDLLFHYLAAVLDQRGQAGLKELVGRDAPSYDEMHAAFSEAARRGFGGRFPQLLLAATIWLPFERNLMIEEPNWDGEMDRYGSVPRLHDEVTAVREAITDADPTVAQSAKAAPESKLVLVGAWRCSETILRLTIVANEKQLPLLRLGD
jgi:hypothetical protein